MSDRYGGVERYGPPARLTGWLAVGAAVLAVAGVLALHGKVTAALVGILAGVAGAAGVELGGRRGNRHVALGSVCLVAGVVLALGAVALTLLSDPLRPLRTPLLDTQVNVAVDALLAALLVLVTFAATTAQRETFVEGTDRTFVLLAASAVPVGVLFAATFLTGQAVSRSAAIAGAVGSFLSQPHEPGLWLLLGCLSVALFGVRRALLAAPVPDFLAAEWHRRAAVTGSRLGPKLAALGVLTSLGAAVAGAAALGGAYAGFRASYPAVYDALAAVGTTVGLRYTLLALGAAGVGVSVLAPLLRYLHGARLRVVRPFAAMVGGVPLVLATLLVPLGERAGGLLESYPAVVSAAPTPVRPVVTSLRYGEPVGTAEMGTLLAAVAVLVAFTLVAGALVALRLVVALRIVPDHATGFAVAGGGVFVAAALVGLVGGAPLVVFGCVALALVAWDLGEYAVTLGSELGRAAPSVRGQFVHVGGTAAVGALSVGVPLFAFGNRGALVPSAAEEVLAGALVVLLAATLVLLALVVLRR